jgi:hypothetical protein
MSVLGNRHADAHTDVYARAHIDGDRRADRLRGGRDLHRHHDDHDHVLVRRAVHQRLPRLRRRLHDDEHHDVRRAMRSNDDHHVRGHLYSARHDDHLRGLLLAADHHRLCWNLQRDDGQLRRAMRGHHRDFHGMPRRVRIDHDDSNLDDDQ